MSVGYSLLLAWQHNHDKSTDNISGCGFSYMHASKMKTQPATILLLVLSVASQLPQGSRAQCPAGCFGCQATGVTTRVTCTARGLAAFPLFPVDIQQTLEEL